MAHTQVLLREDIDNLGARGEIVRVKTGYARNYLLPRNLAVEATANNVRQIEGEKAALAKREAKERGTAELQGDQLRKLTLKFERKVGEAGVLYGSVTSMDIAHELKEQGYEIDRRKIVLREPIKRFGSYRVPVRLHREVTVDLPIQVLGEGGVEVDVEALAAEADNTQEVEPAKENETNETEEYLTTQGSRCAIGCNVNRALFFFDADRAFSAVRLMQLSLTIAAVLKPDLLGAFDAEAPVHFSPDFSRRCFGTATERVRHFQKISRGLFGLSLIFRRGGDKLPGPGRSVPFPRPALSHSICQSGSFSL